MTSHIEPRTFTIADSIISLRPGYYDGVSIPSDQEIEGAILGMKIQKKDAMTQLREYRNKLLHESDWVVMKYMSRSQTTPRAWMEYMNALRNLPETQTPTLDTKGDLDMKSITIPKKPEFTGSFYSMQENPWSNCIFTSSNPSDSFKSNFVKDPVGGYWYHKK